MIELQPLLLKRLKSEEQLVAEVDGDLSAQFVLLGGRTLVLSRPDADLRATVLDVGPHAQSAAFDLDRPAHAKVSRCRG